MRLALVGLRGCGKTTVGRLLARRLNVPFRDSDEEVTRVSGLTPDRLIAEQGEDEFRSWERRAVSRLATLPAAVLSLGGGAPTQESVRDALDAWDIALLEVEDRVLAERIAADRRSGAAVRPPLTDLPLLDEIGELRRLRFTVYRSFATLIVDASHGSPDEIADRLLASLKRPPQE